MKVFKQDQNIFFTYNYICLDGNSHILQFAAKSKLCREKRTHKYMSKKKETSTTNGRRIFQRCMISGKIPSSETNGQLVGKRRSKPRRNREEKTGRAKYP